jgi:F-type H+-transporting ATPase subunit alpha
MQDYITEFNKIISEFTPQIEATEYGHIISVLDGVIHIVGIPGCKMSEKLVIHTKLGERVALAQNIERDSVGAIIVGSSDGVCEGDKVTRSESVFSIPVGKAFLGRVLDPLMIPLDTDRPVSGEKEYPIERLAPGVMHREPVNQPLQTGIKVIDALVPIGLGQRELIIGDRQTGKTTVAIDTIINQKGKDVYCIYVSIGQKQSRVMEIFQDLENKGAMEYTTIISASASDSAAYLYLAPYCGVTLAEYFMDQGKNVVIIYDDLSKHAVAYREMSLLLRRPPGREAYPGDVFYLHSRLLERACRRNAEHGGGSITALPIIETQAGDISAYIPTNVISITDGQIFLETSLFNKGVRPAINPGLSVSRVGGSAQIKSMKKVAGPLKLSLAQARELESFSQFDSDLDPQTKASLDRGKRFVELLKQPIKSPMRTSVQVAILYAATKGYFDTITISDVISTQNKVSAELLLREEELLSEIEKNWSEQIEEKLKKALSIILDSLKE